MSDLITTKELAKRTGYTEKYIAELVRTGKLIPDGRISRSFAFRPDALAPRPDMNHNTNSAKQPEESIKKIIKICGLCKQYELARCIRTNSSTHRNRIACKDFDEDPEAIKAIKNRDEDIPNSEVKTYFINGVNKVTDKEMAPALNETSEQPIPEVEQEPTEAKESRESIVVRVYKETNSVKKAAQAANTTWITASLILEKLGLRVRDGSPVVKKSTDDLPKGDIREFLLSDFTEAQKALALIDTVRSTYGGEVPEIEAIILDQYRKRRHIA